jgi:ribonuclease T2
MSIFIPILAFLVLILVVFVVDYYFTPEPTALVDPTQVLNPRPNTAVSASTVKTTVSAPLASQAKFDFYVLALSWSPDYCATDGQNDAQQCSIGKKLGFVLHGLWPNYERGYPEYCSTQKMPPDVRAKFPNLYPSSKLYDHEWEKHGTCSGLSPESYLELSKTLKNSVQSPAAYRTPENPFRSTSKQLKSDFTFTNPALFDASLAVYCSGSGRFLSEVFVCFSPDGEPAACSNDVQTKALRSCGNPDFLVRNVR